MRLQIFAGKPQPRETLQIDMKERVVRFGRTLVKEGDIVTLDGNEGLVYGGALVRSHGAGPRPA